jgi:uncharacterized membrane protein YbhN (UPF0104 family)
MLSLAVLGHLLNAAAFMAIGHGLGLETEPVAAMGVLAIAFFLAALPVAFGGWGAREAAVAAGFAALGEPPALAVAVSIAYGLMVLAGGLPGLVLAVIPRRGPAQRP